MILTIDPGSSLGYSIWIDGDVQEYGTLTVAPSSKAPLEQRILEMSSHIDGLFGWGPTKLILEDVNVVQAKSRDASRWRSVTWAYPRILAADKGIEVIEVVPTRLKKYITGRGNARKVEMVQEIRDRMGLGRSKLDHNTADALALGYYYYGELEGKRCIA